MCRFKGVLLYCIFILSVVCCENKNTRFNKTQYLESCGLSIEQMLLSERKEDSLVRFVFDMEHSPNLHYRNELIDDANILSCKALLLEYGRRLSHGYNDSLLFDHYYALGISATDSPRDIIDLTLSYAKGQSSDIKKRIGEASFPIAKCIDDTLAFQAIDYVVGALAGSSLTSLVGRNADYLSDTDAQLLMKWSKIGLEYAESMYDPSSWERRQMLDHLTYCSWKLGDSQFDNYVDSLLVYIFNRGKPDYYFGNSFNGAIYSRYLELLRDKDYSYAEHIVNFFCPSTEETDSTYLPLKNLLPDRQRRDYHEPMLPDSSNVIISKLNRDVIWLILNVGNEGIVDINTMCFFEKARMAYLKGDTDYSTWLNRAFYEGVYSTFPSSAREYLDNYIRPEHQYNQGLVNLLTLQYNNKSSESVYDALLFIKGASETIPPDVYKSIKDHAPREIVEYVDSIRAFGIKSRLGWERDYLENEIGPNIKGILRKNITSYKDIRETIGDDSAAIEFYAAPSFDLGQEFCYRAAILTSDEENPIIVDLCPDYRMREILFNKDLYNSFEAYSVIWAPIEKSIVGKKSIYFSMDRLLNMLNLQALMMPDKNRLSQKYHLIQLTSTKEILADDITKPYESIALFGGIDYNTQNNGFARKSHILASPMNVNRSVLRSFKRDDFKPLPYSQIEIDEIATCATKNNITIQYFNANDGTEEAFKHLSGQHLSILHIATHGFYYSKNQSKEIDFFKLLNDQDDPLERCGLLLAGSQTSWRHPNSSQAKEDGILLGDEIAKLDFSNVDLVVLSACKSALGDINSEGVVGLRQAFKRAGAKSILLTLNNIDDRATAYFMSLFYNHLFETGDKYESFNHAITGMKSSKDYSNPDYWAHFVMID